MDVRPLDIAQHEAAHVVVGVALGLRLRAAVVGARAGRIDGVPVDGWAWFHGGARRREAIAVMTAAGVAWDRAVGAPAWRASLDLRGVRELTSGRHGVATAIACAAAVLSARAAAHARVTRALLARDLTGDDLAAIARGEALED